MPPSGAPTRPSALSGPCHTSFHLAPAAMTPGISVTVTSRAAAGCGKFCSPPALRCCATAVSLRARADPRKQQAIAHIAFNFIPPQVAWPASRAKPEFPFAPGRRQYIPELLAKGRGPGVAGRLQNYDLGLAEVVRLSTGSLPLIALKQIDQSRSS